MDLTASTAWTNSVSDLFQDFPDAKKPVFPLGNVPDFAEFFIGCSCLFKRKPMLNDVT